ncbi:helix-turn-helix transcriptional regulator [Luteipulveratus halotolerans]|uniref:HTH luxR-type domain-containing protein n=1 Tax=Luteipulveratus halotolerans TaxID=1631356 RepID=A0A0L6CKH5_9MICO|nr:helix-turn-helix transcriptional regulator [Luteipulveratus halotolerans]KNX38301.1 hypothetical protein VV01_15995 [Luteipulveratus halotolerans]
MSDVHQEFTEPSRAPRRGLGDLLGSDLTANVYLALLQRPTVTADQLRAEIDPDASQDDLALALHALESGRLVRRVDSERWAVFPPERALGSYASRLEERARAVRSSMVGLTRLHESSTAARRGDELPVRVQLLRTLDEISGAMGQLFAGAEDDVVSMRRASPRVLHMLDQPEETHEEPVFNAEGREIHLRVSFDKDLLQHPNLHRAVEIRRRVGDQVRFSTQVPFTATVSDAGMCVVDIDDPGGSIIGLQITHPGVSAVIRRVIDSTWQTGLPWRGRDGEVVGEGVVLDPKDADILTLLTSGAADATIARQLGISQRTVERRVRRMLDHLNASTRFQAGVQAAKRGWI